VFLNAVDLRDVRVVERRQDLGFAFKAGQPLGVLREGLGKDFDRHFAGEPSVLGAVHFAHTARADGRENLVGTQASSGS
jgi:hypothetical protein